MTEEQILEQASKLVPSVISTWLTPKITNLIDSGAKSVKGKGELIHHDFYKNRFEEYLSRRYTKFFTIDTLVFPNYQTLFDTIYFPLTLKKANVPIDEDRKLQQLNDLIAEKLKKANVSIDEDRSEGIRLYEEVADAEVRGKIPNRDAGARIDSYPEQIFEKFYRILIKDSAGMGKSTISRKIFLEIIRGNKGIPVLIELRKLSKENTIINELTSQLNSIGKECDKEFVLRLIQRGDFIFLFDGFDEIPLAERESVATDLHTFVEKTGNCKFLITSRPESSLASLGDFQEFNIVPLAKEESFAIFKNYDNYAYRPFAFDLIETIKKEKLGNINEFLTNPFLASLVYKTFDYKKDIPLQKEQFYRQVYDALFENHDLTKEGYYKREKYSKLHTDDFERVLRSVGYKTMRLGKVEYSKNEILDIIARARKFCVGLDFKPSDFLEDLVSTVPLMKKEGLVYKWSHKSLQDYFAARFILLDAGNKKNDILLELFNKRMNDNVIDLFAFMDYKSFKHVIIRQLMIEFKDHALKLYQLFADRIDEKALVSRIELSFGRDLYIKVIKGPVQINDRRINTVEDELTEIFKNRGSYEPTSGAAFVDEEMGYVSIHVLSRINTLPHYIVTRLPVYINKNLINSGVSPWESPKTRKLLLRAMEEEIVIRVDCNPSLFYNSNGYFDISNEFYVGLNCCLKYNESLKLLREIEEEISQQEQEEDFF